VENFVSGGSVVNLATVSNANANVFIGALVGATPQTYNAAYGEIQDNIEIWDSVRVQQAPDAKPLSPLEPDEFPLWKRVMDKSIETINNKINNDYTVTVVETAVASVSTPDHDKGSVVISGRYRTEESGQGSASIRAGKTDTLTAKFEPAGVDFALTGLSWNGVDVFTDGMTEFEFTAGETWSLVARFGDSNVTAPSAPTNLSAVPRDGQIELSWAAPESDGGSPITRYEAAINSTPWIEPDGAFSHTFAGLQNGVEYTFRVRAVNVKGGGAETVIKGIPAKPTTPGKPVGFTALPGDRQVLLSWGTPKSDGGSAITGYEVSSNGGATWIDAGNVLSYTFESLVNGMEYTFKVRAVNANGSGSEESAAAKPGVPTVPGKPLNLAAEPGDGTVALEWFPPESDGGSEITGYEAAVGDSPWTTVSAALSHTFTGLSNGTEYTFKVRAINEKGSGPESSITATPGSASAATPGAPGSLTAASGDGHIVLGWAAPEVTGGSEITGYEVSIGSDWTGASGRRSHTFTGLTNGTEYTLRVRALNDAGSGPAASITAAPGSRAGGNPDAPAATPEVETTPVQPVRDGVEAADDVRWIDAAELARLPGNIADASVIVGGIAIADSRALTERLPSGSAEAIDTDKSVLPLPIFNASVSKNGGTAVVTMRTTLNGFAGEIAGDVVMLKLRRDNGRAAQLAKASSLRDIGGAQYILTDVNGSVVPDGSEIVQGREYLINIAIEDDSPYDWDPEPRSILDPAILAVKKTSDGGSQDNPASGGGCSSGAFGAAAMALIALKAARKRKA
jgi:hypothetical protein